MEEPRSFASLVPDETEMATVTVEVAVRVPTGVAQALLDTKGLVEVESVRTRFIEFDFDDD